MKSIFDFFKKFFNKLNQINEIKENKEKIKENEEKVKQLNAQLYALKGVSLYINMFLKSKSKNYELSWKKIFDEIVDAAKRENLEVIIKDVITNTKTGEIMPCTRGRYYFFTLEGKWVSGTKIELLNDSIDVMAITLAHELGHHFSVKTFNDRSEEAASYFGFYLLKFLMGDHKFEYFKNIINSILCETKSLEIIQPNAVQCMVDTVKEELKQRYLRSTQLKQMR